MTAAMQTSGIGAPRVLAKKKKKTKPHGQHVWQNFLLGGRGGGRSGTCLAYSQPYTAYTFLHLKTCKLACIIERTNCAHNADILAHHACTPASHVYPSSATGVRGLIQMAEHTCYMSARMCMRV
eukprot:NODE_1366_length_982_cov_824.259378_g953_i0.p2 GENE.NODE_1366_length_982_cov_824.259378_g953_i0~~NODE_1366_length_982_cov_824.259378_g953_i0.p2  ORF type:complete len:124 (-),score=3.22 NODE_1366_length_982_cov_824.259378_g953_i0:262-633(-)